MIFFDIDGTLVDHTGAERAAALAFQKDHASRFPEQPEAFVRRWRTVADVHLQRYLAGEIVFQDQRRARIREMFGDNGLTSAAADDLFAGYLSRYEQHWRLFSDVLPCLRSMAGLRLGIISNGDSRQQRAKLEVLGIAGHFASVTISGDVQIAKPEAGIFAAACRINGVRPEECVYVGDDCSVDAVGSRRAGMRGIWLNRNDLQSPEDNDMIRTLTQLKTQIGLRAKAGSAPARNLATREG